MGHSNEYDDKSRAGLVKPGLGGVIASHCGAFKNSGRHGFGKHTKGKVSPYNKPKRRKK
tara:strand:+ start:500 stop:676 length:177 start_codon:yes stop_codon:yes gene_type:complete